MAGLLDVILGYDCNLACDYCTITPAMRERSLGAAQVVAALRQGRQDGLDRAAFTGGEPTIRGDLLGLVRAARTLGYDDVKVQTNGLVLGQGDNAGRLAAAGATRLHISVHTHLEDRYEALVRSVGSFARMLAGLDAMLATGLPLVVDLIVKEDTYRGLPEAIAWLHDRGVRAVDLWFVSLTDHNAENLASLPRMTAVTPVLATAFAYARAHAMTLRSLHVPRCLLGEDHAHAFDPGAARVRVLTPDACFDLKASRLAGQQQVPACRGCEFAAICPGLRPDYLAVYGDGEVAAARGQAPTIAARRGLPVI
ncbi:MAG: radical SAM protein [Nannocystis sp.]|uniref:radical SAM protein n=1 Tax=Nannocystis sp. TaxID=1962667 RepID=UPI002425F334|nr:radical SAM protein [Nannocystis sp.]MBK9754551.1 radical SAM protein [Nannocystis sp.]